MRYLYGDSAPFPLQYNFLATLEAFVGSAARAVQLDAELRKLSEAAAQAAAVRSHAAATLEGFHQTIMHALSESGMRSTEPQVLDYVRQVAEHAGRIVEEAKRSAQAAAERDQANARVEVDKHKGEIRKSLEQFLTVARVPVLESRVGMGLVDGRNQLSAVFTHPEGIVTSFTLASPPAWSQPRKVGDFAQGLNLMIGVKKSLFKRTVQPESVHLDEYVVTGFDLSDDTAEIRLRRRLAEPHDTFIFRLRRVDADLHCDVQRPGEVESEAGVTIDSADRAQLERLWQLLRAGVADALGSKERLVGVTVDGADLFEQNRTVAFVERIIKMIGPTVVEISRRSPNPHELSLKTENDGGRREEIYLKKEDLASKIEALREKERALFAPLSLGREKWLSDTSVIVTE